MNVFRCMIEWMKERKATLERMSASYSCWLMFYLWFSVYSCYFSLLRRPPLQTTLFQNPAYSWDAHSNPTLCIKPESRVRSGHFKLILWIIYLIECIIFVFFFCFMTLCLDTIVRLNYVFKCCVEFHPLTFYEKVPS